MKIEERIELAKKSSEPTENLRKLAIDLKNENMSKDTMLQLFELQRELHSKDRDETIYNAILDVMDEISGWCHPLRQLYD